MAICPVCGEKAFSKAKVIDGFVCYPCVQFVGSQRLSTVESVRKGRNINQSRLRFFAPTSCIKDFALGTISIDAEHRFFRLGKQVAIFSFDEVSSYYEETKGGKTQIISKGHLGRAVVGGALFGMGGALIGANTSKKEIKTTGEKTLTHIIIDSCFGRKDMVSFGLSYELKAFIDDCIANRLVAPTQNRDSFVPSPPPANQTSVADEILKLKELLDRGALTQGEFDDMKKKLLG